MIAKPVNKTQRRFNELCALGGGPGGGPARTKVQELLKWSGEKLNGYAYEEISAMLAEFPDRNPWHVCFALGISWGRLARFEADFVEAAVNVLEHWNEADLKVARSFHRERGPEPIAQSLQGGHVLFASTQMPATLPDDIAGYARAQQRWLDRLGKDRPRYIGSWNATAMFMVALFSNKALGQTLTGTDVLLPTGGPIFNALSILHHCHVLPNRAVGYEADDQSIDLTAIFTNNCLFADLRRGREDWSLLDVHSGLYMLGNRLAESDGWF